MIRQLMREQARAHRAYLGWTAALLTLAITLVAWATLDAIQQYAIHEHAAEAYGASGASSAYVTVGSSPTADLTLEELDAVLAEAQANGSEPTAIHDVWALAIETRDHAGSTSWQNLNSVVGITGAADWDGILLEGAAPGTGEIAVDSGWAARMGVGVGDTVAVTTAGWSEDYEELSPRKVSGLLRTGVDGRYSLVPYAAVLEWEDSFALETATEAKFYDDDAEALDMTTVEITTRGPDPAIDAVGARFTPWMGNVESGAILLTSVTAVVLVLGMAGLAFAAGRAQAASRAQWLATARVLGARRSHVVLASLAELGLVGLVAGVAGTALGLAIHAAMYAELVVANPAALMPGSIAVPGWFIPASVGLGVVLSLILGAIPAFWATRVAPVAALKPVNPVTEAEVSRRISAAWIYGVWTLLSVTLVLAAQTGEGPGGESAWLWIVWGVGVAWAIATVAMLVELCRAAVRLLGHRLSRSRRPWLLAAGDALRSCPRQAAVPTAVLAVAALALGVVATWMSLTAWTDVIGTDADDSAWWRTAPTLHPSQSDGGILLIGAASTLAVLVLASFATFAASRQAAAADHDAREALGLSTLDARLASAVQFAAPMLAGLGLGLALGVAAAVGTFRYQVPVGGWQDGVIETTLGDWTWALAHLGHALVPLGMVALLGVAPILLGAAGAAAIARVSHRTDALTGATR
ncbi:ABC transporter permease [Demequina silvatica]|uniref:ABC transporter permease n=1 Tax=Demequina silvatica TaxID=1638988 RepID=UPI000785434C|nr:FtsX-like permease family protein [Demequina silvatica]